MIPSGSPTGGQFWAARSIAVDCALHTSAPDIYAAGDCADAFHVVTGQRTWIPLALRANRAGWAVADNVCGIDRRLAGVVGSAVFKVFDLQVARTGLNEAEARKAGLEPAAVVIKSRSRAHAHPGASDIWVYMVGDRGSGRLLGVQMVGRDGVAHRLQDALVEAEGGADHRDLHAAVGILLQERDPHAARQEEIHRVRARGPRGSPAAPPAPPRSCRRGRRDPRSTSGGSWRRDRRAHRLFRF